MRRLLELDTMMIFSPVVDGEHVRAERFNSDGYADGLEVARLFLAAWTASPIRYAWYDPVSPEGWQRNRVIDARDLMNDDELAQSAIYQKCLVPARLHRQRQPRVLVCEGKSLLGWFGSFHDGRVETRHRTLLSRLIAPVRQRLSADRRLAAVLDKQQALDVALDEIGAPALIVGRDGRIHESNAAARALADARGGELAASVTDAIAKRPSAIELDLVPVQGLGVAHGWLAIARGSRDQRLVSSIDAASRRWGLSPRQREILSNVVRGASNLAIASVLGVTQRAVELQVSSLFVRACVESRAGLVAAVLGTFG
ncbi:MAG TPA: helix-turn-helix transcriptional regulator [Kofleriaceae bacterium]|nr:helix-turn-helix transcriptional regulator [Kofleriaceae bacterium]